MKEKGEAHLMALFEMGQMVTTPGALEALQAAGISPQQLLSRHAQGDWGDLSQDDLVANNQALVDGSRILSAYELPGLDQKVWIITEAVGDDGQRASKDMILVQDSDSRVCWINGQLKRHTPGARARWTCRKITPLQLVKLAPARRIMEALGEAC